MQKQMCTIQYTKQSDKSGPKTNKIGSIGDTVKIIMLIDGKTGLQYDMVNLFKRNRWKEYDWEKNHFKTLQNMYYEYLKIISFLCKNMLLQLH